ncbi:retrotransposon hot spot (RHS) protein [Trypanosoma cruzi]|nr:retrotransposon hot spot (RHS) protein [Trypanosoma cruzi]
MPPKQNRVQGGNAKSRASAVPQGGRRRAIEEFEGKRDQPSATQIRAESQQPQWTTYSYIKDILLERNTNRIDMMLNDFLRSYLGGKGVVRRNENVIIDAFLWDPRCLSKTSSFLKRFLT